MRSRPRVRRFRRVVMVALLLLVLIASVAAFLRWRARPPAVAALALAAEVVSGFDHALGGFRLQLAADPPLLEIRVPAGRIAFASPVGRAFVGATLGSLETAERSGHLKLNDRVTLRCGRQVLERVEVSAEEVRLGGTLRCGQDDVPYSLSFQAVDGDRLALRLELPAPYRAELLWQDRPGARVYGFGVQYSRLDLQGRRVPVVVAEQGVGRGRQPLTLAAELQSGAGGAWHSSYAALPWMLSSDLRGLYLLDTVPSIFDLRARRFGRLQVFAPQLNAHVVTAATPAGMLEAFTRYAGRMRPLPEWLASGAVLGLQGGTERVERILADVRAAGVPLAAVWLQDWVGQRSVGFGERLWWNWELDRERYPDWEGLVERLQAQGTRVLLYINPFLVDVADRPGSQRNLFQEAAEAGYLVESPQGEPYLLDQNDFVAGLVDLSDDRARSWLLQVLEQQLLTTGASGWMADFGEGLPLDGRLAAGDALAWHNHYPEAWAAFNRELIERQPDADDYVFFLRSGFTRSPGAATLFWLGDQLVSWDRHDGLKSAVTGLLSSGLSGFSLEHGDIGGYTSIGNPLLRQRRSAELLARWSELAAFTVVFRSHEGNRPSENPQVYDGANLPHFAAMARLHEAWRAERTRLVAEAAETGLPLVRHPFLHYPDDPGVLDLRWQFLVGENLLVAPVLDPGRERAKAYLPRGSGSWVHLWTGTTYAAGEGSWVEVEAPLGQPAVFYRQGSAVGAELEESLAAAGLIAPR